MGDYSFEKMSVDEIIDYCFDEMGLDVDEGIELTGDEETYVSVLNDFYKTAESRCALIEKTYKDGDISAYVIEVHSLKSTAKTVGADSLSALARELEFAGRENNLTVISDKTDKLLAKFRILIDKLSKIFYRSKDSLEYISKDRLFAGLSDIYESVSVFDYDTADSIIAELDKYKVPDELVDSFDKIKLFLAEVDRDALLKFIKELIPDGRF
ncbi:MAG: Hpt domain-containing protein [Lachnospiraceae bacterium]|nr:Hpt domain-containing protein [Lachnospiraceae bacterium]